MSPYWETKMLTGALHDDVINWKHIPRYWPFVRGIHRSPVNSPHKRQWRGAFMFSLIWAWLNGWVNNREAGDLRRHHAHYDVIVMWGMYGTVIWVLTGWGNGVSPVRGQLNVWTNADLIIGPLGTNFRDILIECHDSLSRKCIYKCRLKMVAILW